MKSFNLNLPQTKPIKVKDISYEQDSTLKSSYNSLNNLFGDGLIEGHTFQITGYRGVGKTTMILQMMKDFSNTCSTLFLTNEESVKQIARKCKRLNVENVDIAFQNNLQDILDSMKNYQLVIVDSFQGIFSGKLKEAEVISLLVKTAKETGCCFGIISHMTKDKKEKGGSEISHLVDQCIKISHGVPEYFCINESCVIVHSDKNREGKTGYIIFRNGENGYNFEFPWDENLIENLDKEAFRND